MPELYFILLKYEFLGKSTLTILFIVEMYNMLAILLKVMVY